MRRVAVLMLLMALNVGAVVQELIFSEGTASGRPDAWAQAVDWRPEAIWLIDAFESGDTSAWSSAVP